MSAISEFLRKVPLFADLSDADLDGLCTGEVTLGAGELLFEEGQKGDRAYVIREGQVEILKAQGDREVLLSVRGPGDVIGETALLEDTPRTATVRSRSVTRLLVIGKEPLDRLLATSAAAARAMLFTALSRFRSTQAMVRQSEKMAQLGTLTAGVAHELNNPAAAVQRGASQLTEALAAHAQALSALAEIDLTQAQKSEMLALAAQARERAAKPFELDALARADREQELEAWLEDHGVEEPWELAPVLVDLGLDPAGLQERFGAPLLPKVTRYLGATRSVSQLVALISQGASRISDIVRALKSYSYLDQAPVQEVDVHQGLDDTLLILRHDLKGLTVRREYDPALPRIHAYGSELNQVWTNLIDNAADALGGKGTITLATRCESDWVIVEVEDDGPGIPPEVQARVFEAFFTTKPPGQGTGLGLDITWRIVTDRHRGDIKVFSQPGRTVFRVRLPVDPSKTDARPAPGIHRPPDIELSRILDSAHTVAVVGLSQNPDRPAHTIPKYLQSKGYKVVPVNPNVKEALGEKSYADLASVPGPVDVVLVFRPSEEVPRIVEDAIGIGAKVVWMQEGIVHEQAAEAARAAGLQVVMDTCMRQTHQRLQVGS